MKKDKWESREIVINAQLRIQVRGDEPDNAKILKKLHLDCSIYDDKSWSAKLIEAKEADNAQADS